MKTLVAVVRYLLITAIMFLGVDHFMSNEQGLIALPIAALWFVWTSSIGSFSSEVRDSSSLLDSVPTSYGSDDWHYGNKF